MTIAADDAASVAIFEAAFHALPAFASAELFVVAGQCYARSGRGDGAWLMHALAQQMGRTGSVRLRDERDLPPRQFSDEARDVLLHPEPATGLLRRLEQLDREQATLAAASLFEAVFEYLPPVHEYWIYYRMTVLHAGSGRSGLAFLLASVALQLEPLSPESRLPARIVLDGLLRQEDWAEAAALLAQREQANPGQELLDSSRRERLLDQPNVAAALTQEGVGRRVLVAASLRPAMTIPVYGRALPHCLRPLLEAQERRAITLAELDDAELLIAGGAVGVWASDGAAQPELSTGLPPGLVQARLADRRRAGEPVDELRVERAVLIADMFPSPNLCHFLLDQATRLALYAGAGIDLGQTVVIGPELLRPYQRVIASRMGVRRYLGIGGYGRIQVTHLAVLSNCHHLQHSAHLGADWAVTAVRTAFAEIMPDRPPARRLLVSRSDTSTRQLVNEDVVLRLLRPHGFERIVPGDLDLPEQIRAFAAATHVVAPHGAALANIVFCAPATDVLEIFHPHYGSYAYAMLAPALGLRYSAMLAWDGDDDDVAHNDPALAQQRSDASLTRHIRAEPADLQDWIRSSCAM